MNILYIDHYAGSLNMGMEYRPYYLAREWVEMGNGVSIIAGDYSHLRKRNPSVSTDMQREVIDGIDYYWLKTGEYKGNGVKRALTMLRFCYKLYRYKRRIKDNLRPDVIISSSTYPIDSIPAHKIAKISKALHVHEVHDMWPLTLTEMGGMSKFNPFVILMQFGENYAYSKADMVVSLLDYAKDYMMLHGLKEGRFHYIPNGVVEKEWDHPEKLPEEHESILTEIKENGDFIVGYFGGHARVNCLISLIMVARQMKEERVHFVLVGEGPQKNDLIKEAEGLNNITFLPAVNKKAIPSLTEYFDCIYIGAVDSPLYRFGIGLNKMFDSMMAAKPIVFAIDTPTTQVEEAGCGYIIKPENTEQAVNVIKRLVSMSPGERYEIGQKGRTEVLKKYTYRKLAEQFLEMMTSRNILYINHYAGSPGMGMEFRPYYLSKEWNKMGYKVDIISADFSHLRINNPTVNRDFDKEEIDGVTYNWIRTSRYEGNGIKRAITMFEFVGKLYVRAKWIAEVFRPDIIITSSTYPLDIYGGLRIKKYSPHAKLIHEIHDMWPAILTEGSGMSKFNPFVVVMQMAENRFCKQSDHVVSLLPCSKEYLVKHGMRETKYFVVTNGVNIEDWESSEKPSEETLEQFRNIKTDGKFIICYFGSITNNYALSELAEAVQSLENDNVVVVFVGDGPFKDQLRAATECKHPERFAFLDKIPKNQVPEMLKMADALYVGGTDNTVFRYGIGMNKLFDSMMAGKPILYAVDAPNNYIKDYDCGISVEAGNVSELAEGIKQLVSLSEEDRCKLGENGHNAVLKNFTYDTLAKKFARLFNE